MKQSERFTYRPSEDRDRERLSTMLAECFAYGPEFIAKILDKIGAASVYVLTDEREEIVAGAAVHDFGQFFGGRRLRMGGLGLVGVPPAQRGKGTAKAFLRHFLRDLHDRGFALSVLYPATRTLYRRAGFDCAGIRMMLETDPHRILINDREMEALQIKDLSAMRRIYGVFAARHNGMVDRLDWRWSNMLKADDKTPYCYLVGDPENPQGYMVYYMDIVAGKKKIHVEDYIALTPSAGRRLLSLLADTKTQVDMITWMGAPHDPFVGLMPEPSFKVNWLMEWMLRLVNVPKAFEERGFPEGLETELHLEVDDPWIEENRGAWRVKIAGGRARAERGGEGRIRVDIQTLATVFSGHRDASAARFFGNLEAPDSDIARLDMAFLGPRPWMPDMF